MCAAGSLPALTKLTIRSDMRQLEIEESVLSCYVTLAAVYGFGYGYRRALLVGGIMGILS
jgi:hypothetical protein